jgi:HlyD family secretion protein
MDFLQQIVDWFAGVGVAIAATLGIGGAPASVFQGYVEGEYVRLAAPEAGTLQLLKVVRGDHVAAGDLVFTLDLDEETAARDAAAARLHQAQAQLEDLRKGKRPSEIEAMEAKLAQAKAGVRMSELHLRRQEQLRRTKVSAQQQLDEAQADYDRDVAAVNELTAELTTAKLPARDDAIMAAEATVRTETAMLADAEAKLAKRTVRAPAAAFVDDTLYRVGEEITAGAAVVSLLPPENIKVRFFVPEPLLSQIRVGQRVAVACDGCAKDLAAEVSYIAPDPEFTPPVIYSNETRAKLVFLIEARPTADPARLHPGQPVTVTLTP